MKKYLITIILVAMSVYVLADTSVIGISGLSRQSNGDIAKSISTDKLNITGKSIFSTITATTYKGISASAVVSAYNLYSTNQTLGSGNYLVACHAKTNATLKLPSGNTISGREYKFKKIDSTTNKCFINATTTNTVDGFQTYSGLDTQNEAISVVSRGPSGWLIFGSY